MHDISEENDRRLEQIASVAEAEPLGGIHFIAHAGLILFGGVASAILYGMVLPLQLTILYVLLLTLEKFVANRARANAKASEFPIVAALLFLRALLYNIIVLFIWLQDGDIFKMAALALLVAATINIMVYHATYPLIMALVVGPIWMGFAAIAASFLSFGEITRDGIAAIIVFMAVSPYFYLSLRSAHERWANLRRTQQALSQAQKIDIMGRVAGGVSHDFNNILSVVSGSLQLLEQAKTDEERQQHIDAALRAADHGASLNKQMLALGKRSPLLPKPTNLDDALREFRDFARRVLPETIDIRLAFSSQPLVVLVDPGMLQSALLNLALNAKEAMPDGGKLLVSIGQSSKITDRDPIAFIRIIDNGIGIAPDLLEQVFEPFFTTRAVGGGSGLGLPMVKGFAEQSSGYLTLTSKPELGTTVTIYLPMTTAQSAKTASPQAADPDPETQSGKLMVVEDNAQLLQILRTKLTLDGYDVVACENGEAAARELELRRDFDLVLCDMVMPGDVQGLDFLKLVRGTGRDIRFVLMSGYAPVNDHEQKAQLSDVDLFLEKPLDLKTLGGDIATLLKR